MTATLPALDECLAGEFGDDAPPREERPPGPNLPGRRSKTFLIGAILDELPRMRRRLRNGGLETRRRAAVALADLWARVYLRRLESGDVPPVTP